MSPERPEQDDFLEDEEQEEYGQRSIFATGWFRAVLVLLVLAVIAVIAIPLIGGWFEPSPPKVTTKPSEPPSTLAPVPSAAVPTAPATPAPSQMPSAPPPTLSPAVAPTPAPQPAPTPPPAVTTPAPVPAPARPEMPPATAPTAAEKAKAPERTAAVTPSKSAAKPAVSSGSYWVQVGAFKEDRNAEGLAKALRSKGFAVQVTRVTRDEPLHVVRVGGYPDRSRATAAREELQGKGHPGFVTSGPAK